MGHRHPPVSYTHPDTVWGLGCDATNAEAVDRIYKLKRSENKKSMLVLCASADMVVRYVNTVSYTHLDVYKRQVLMLGLVFSCIWRA